MVCVAHKQQDFIAVDKFTRHIQIYLFKNYANLYLASAFVF